MSTSKRVETPQRYMHIGGSNVMWELLTSAEDEQGFHSGADVSMLSQFSHEQEELFPPLTLLRVVRREKVYADGSKSVLSPSEWQQESASTAGVAARGAARERTASERTAGEREGMGEGMGEVPARLKSGAVRKLVRWAHKTKQDEVCVRMAAEFSQEWAAQVRTILRYGGDDGHEKWAGRAADQLSYLNIVVQPTYV